MGQAGYWVALWDSWALGKVVSPGAEVLGDARDGENGDYYYAHADYCLSAEMLLVDSWSGSGLRTGDQERVLHRVNAADNRKVVWAKWWLHFLQLFLINPVCCHPLQSSEWDR